VLCFGKVEAKVNQVAKGGGDDMISQDVQYIWPTTLWSIPLVGKGDKPTLMEKATLAKLAKIGEAMWLKYRDQILPIELKTDPAFAAEYAADDNSRLNFAFMRWQKRVFCDKFRVPTHEVSFDGGEIPKYDTVEYIWKEFYGSPEYKILRKTIERVVNMYLKRMNKMPPDGKRHKFRTFIWAEVYGFADAQRPYTRTGAFSAGRVTARFTKLKGYGQKVAFEDARGINPPFGRTHNHELSEGNLMLHPSWSATFVTPHRLNSTNVFFAFAAWPQEGPGGLDWEDDSTGDYTLKKKLNIKRPKSEAKANRQKSNRRDDDEL